MSSNLIVCLFVSAAQHEENLLIERIEDIRHHIRIESAVQEGSQNMLKHLKVLKTVDKKALQEVEDTAYLLLYCWKLRAVLNNREPFDVKYTHIFSSAVRIVFFSFRIE